MERLHLKRYESLTEIKGYEEIAEFEQIQMKGGGFWSKLWDTIGKVADILTIGGTAIDYSGGGSGGGGRSGESRTKQEMMIELHDIEVKKGGRLEVQQYLDRIQNNRPDTTWSVTVQPDGAITYSMKVEYD